MLLAFPIIALMSLCSGLLWGVGHVRVWLLVFCFAAVVDVALDFLLVPGHAEVGAAWANNSAQVAASILVVGYTIKTFGPFDWQLRVLIRAAVAATVSAFAGWICVILIGGASGVAIGAAVAMIAFVASSRLLRTVPATDAAWILDSVHGRFATAIANTLTRAAAGAPIPASGLDAQLVEH
jgi:O-antigen/teichoic acid export membrane protein